MYHLLKKIKMHWGHDQIIIKQKKYCEDTHILLYLSKFEYIAEDILSHKNLILSSLNQRSQSFWYQEPVSWKKIFLQTRDGGWFGDDSSVLHLLCTLFLI